METDFSAETSVTNCETTGDIIANVISVSVKTSVSAVIYTYILNYVAVACQPKTFALLTCAKNSQVLNVAVLTVRHEIARRGHPL
jgi:hypothetical protein